MDKWFQSKWFVRAVALAFAIVLYIFVNVDQQNTSQSDSTFSGITSETQTLEDVPVEIRIDEENYVVSGVPETVSVSLQGSPGKVTPMVMQRNFDVYVDLEGLGEGQHTVELQHTVSNDITAYIEPKTIEVTIEEKAIEQFTVTADFINSDKMAEGYELVDYTIEPETVTITSSRSVIDQIGSVKVYVNLEGLDESINNRELPVQVYDTQGNEMNVRIEPENIQISAEIDNPSKSVPVTVKTTGELPEGYELNSMTANVEEVEIYSTSAVLDGISEITTEPINLSNVTDSGTIEVQLSLPDGVNVPEMETIEVTLDVEQIDAEETDATDSDTEEAEPPETEATRDIENVQITAEGLADGLAINYIEPENAEMNITITGSESDIGEITTGDLSASIDLSGLEPGEHVVPVTIEGPEPENISITGEYEEVTIEITEMTEEES